MNSNWPQYIDSAETVFEDLKLESRQLLSLKADEACKLMANEAYKQDLWMWDQDWSTQTLKLKKQPKKKKEVTNSKHILAADNSTEDLNSNSKETKEFELLSEEYIDYVEGVTKPRITKEVEDLSRKFAYLYELEDSLPVKRPYLAGYPAWYRKLCSKPGKDPDWMPGANGITTSMQVFSLFCFVNSTIHYNL